MSPFVDGIFVGAIGTIFTATVIGFGLIYYWARDSGDDQ